MAIPGREASAKKSEIEVTVIGESLVDLIERDGTVETLPGGSPFNLANGLARLGMNVEFVTSIGDDKEGELLREVLNRSGVIVLDRSLGLAPTSKARVTLDDQGAPQYRFSVEWALPPDLPIPRARFVHIGSISAFLEPGASTARRLLGRVSPSTIITFDPNIRAALLPSPEESLAIFEETARQSKLVKLSDEDAGWLYPHLMEQGALDHILGLGPLLVVLTRGAKGSILKSPFAGFNQIAAPSNVVDTVGAGDSYMAALIFGLSLQTKWPTTADELAILGEIASAASGITVSRSGADLPTLAELRRYAPHALIRL